MSNNLDQFWKTARSGDLNELSEILHNKAFWATESKLGDLSHYKGMALVEAAKNNQFEIIKFLLDEHTPGGEISPFHKGDALRYAALSSLEIAKFFLIHCPDISLDHKGMAFHHFAGSNSFDGIFFMEANFPNISSYYKGLGLHAAIEYNHIDMVKYLVEQHANEFSQSGKIVALRLALAFGKQLGNFDIFNYLKNVPSFSEVVTNNNRTFETLESSMDPAYQKISDELMEIELSGFDSSKENTTDSNLQPATSTPNSSELNYSLKKDTENYYQSLRLIEAADQNDFNKAKTILEKDNLDYQISSDVKSTALHKFTRLGNIEAVIYILDNCSDLDIELKENILETAIDASQNTMVIFLLNGYRELFDSESLEKAVHLSANLAAYRGKHELLNLLLEDPEIQELIALHNNRFLVSYQRFAAIDPIQYQPIVDRLLQVDSIAKIANENAKRISVLQESLEPMKIKFGPLNKNLYSEELEWITKYALAHPEECEFITKENTFYLKIQNIEVNLSRLLKYSNLSHILLDDIDSIYFNAYRVLTKKETKKAVAPLASEYTLEGHSLSTAERLAIYGYTDEDFYNINYILHGNPPDPHGEIYNRDTFFKTLFVASALNKITPLWTRDPENQDPSIVTYRGETYITPESLSQRIKSLSSPLEDTSKQQFGIIETKPSFISTSLLADISKKEEFQEGKSLLKFVSRGGPLGKNIEPLSSMPEEKEFLILPGHVQIASHTKEDDIDVFEANYITPLIAIHSSLLQEQEFNSLQRLEHPEILSYSAQLTQQLPQIDQLEKLLEVCQYVYDNYLSKPYTDESITVDWDLDTPEGTVQRPNHGLAHTMRVAHLVPILALSLMQNSQNNQFNFNARDVYIVQLTALFSVVGRKNDAGFRDMKENETGYKEFKQTSANLFADFVRKYNFLDMTEDEINQYAHNIAKMGEPGENSPSAILLSLAHKLDLLRCYEEDRVINDIENPLNQYLPPNETTRLMEYAEKLLLETGDRIMTGANETDYNSTLFYTASTNIGACFNALEKVEPPQISLESRSDNQANERKSHEARPAAFAPMKTRKSVPISSSGPSNSQTPPRKPKI